MSVYADVRGGALSQEQIAEMMIELRSHRDILMDVKAGLASAVQADKTHTKESVELGRRVTALEDARPVLVNRDELESLTAQVEGLKRAVWGATGFLAVAMPVGLALLNHWMGSQ